MKLKIIFLGFLVAALFLIAGCIQKTNENKENQTAGATGNVSINIIGNNSGETGGTQIANPASVFCESHGGKLEMRTAADGSQAGYCTITGKECEEWALFRGECTQIHVCTDEEKAAEACTLEYMPVCGNDNNTYGNKCHACAANIDYWTSGDC